MNAPEKVGPYRVERLLARGGMAELFLGRAETAGDAPEWVVLKRVLPESADDPHYVSMLVDEAQIGRLFVHVNLVRAFELLEVEGQHWLVMEYVEGADLARLLTTAVRCKTFLDQALAAHVTALAADGLHFAHQLCDTQGRPLEIVHRDVSPANIIVTRSGKVKVVDFGVARHEEARTVGRLGKIRGKLAYMSPEQARGMIVDRRSDIFSLGAVLYEMLTLSPCFLRRTDQETHRAVLNATIRPMTERRPDTLPELVEIVQRMLRPDPEERYATAAQVAAELRAVTQQERTVQRDELAGLFETYASLGPSLTDRVFGPTTTAEWEPEPTAG